MNLAPFLSYFIRVPILLSGALLINKTQLIRGKTEVEAQALLARFLG